MATIATELTAPRTVSHAEWLVARRQLLAKEKEFTRLRDQLSRERRQLPREPVEKQYVFEGPHGKETLGDLFDGRGQLIIYHFMFGPGWEAGCPSCSYLADHFDGTTIHLAHRDVTLAVISRAPYAQIEAFQRRMGWRFHWVSSFGTDFNYDYHVSATAAEKQTGTADYNYTVMQFPSEERPAAVSSQKRRMVRSITRIRPTHAGSTFSSALTTSSTLSRRGATKRAWHSRWHGFAITTNTTAATSSIQNRPTSSRR